MISAQHLKLIHKPQLGKSTPLFTFTWLMSIISQLTMTLTEQSPLLSHPGHDIDY